MLMCPQEGTKQLWMWLPVPSLRWRRPKKEMLGGKTLESSGQLGDYNPGWDESLGTGPGGLHPTKALLYQRQLCCQMGQCHRCALCVGGHGRALQEDTGWFWAKHLGSSTGKWMELQKITVSEVTQTRKDKCRTVSQQRLLATDIQRESIFLSNYRNHRNRKKSDCWRMEGMEQLKRK